MGDFPSSIAMRRFPFCMSTDSYTSNARVSNWGLTSVNVRTYRVEDYTAYNCQTSCRMPVNVRLRTRLPDAGHAKSDELTNDHLNSGGRHVINGAGDLLRDGHDSVGDPTGAALRLGLVRTDGGINCGGGGGSMNCGGGVGCHIMFELLLVILKRASMWPAWRSFVERAALSE